MSKARVLLATVFLCLGPCVASGQMLQSAGQALDANPQIGSGGYNAVAGGVGGVNSQLYVTGQVTGLARFQGPINYSAPGTLLTNVPSADLSTYTQQSVGMRNVLTQNVYQTNPYYSVAKVVPNLPALKSNTAGVGAFGNYIDASTAGQLVRSAVSEYSSLVSTVPWTAVQPSPASPGPLTVSPEGQGPVASPYLPTPEIKAGAEALFRAPTAAERTELAQQLALVPGLVTTQIQTQVNAEEDTNVNTNVSPAEASPVQENPLAPANVPGATESPLWPQANQECLLDMLIGLQQKKAKGPVPSERQPFAAPGEMEVVRPTRGAGLKPAPPEQGQGLSPRRPGQVVPRAQGPQAAGMGQPFGNLGTANRAESRRNLVELRADNMLIVHGLAGLGPDVFNAHMAKAQRFLRLAKYYDAAGEFEVARIVNPTNPLVQTGLGLSLFCAGERLSAADHFQQAMAMFPPLMETRVDIYSIVDRPSFLRQMDDLEKMLDAEGASAPAPVIFLGTYLSQNLGNLALAHKYAKWLEDKAGDNKLVASYATFVLTGKRPAEISPAPKAAQGTP